MNKIEGVSSMMQGFRTHKICRTLVASLVEDLKSEYTPSATF